MYLKKVTSHAGGFLAANVYTDLRIVSGNFAFRLKEDHETLIQNQSVANLATESVLITSKVESGNRTWHAKVETERTHCCVNLIAHRDYTKNPEPSDW